MRWRINGTILDSFYPFGIFCSVIWTMPMTPDQARMFQEELETICDTRGIWLKVEHDKRPDLKMIRMEISIKVEEQTK